MLLFSFPFSLSFPGTGSIQTDGGEGERYVTALLSFFRELTLRLLFADSVHGSVAWEVQCTFLVVVYARCRLARHGSGFGGIALVLQVPCGKRQ